ncbi:MAG: hypothetical protein AAF942_16460, partial [Pseudomonadota bacterium]
VAVGDTSAPVLCVEGRWVPLTALYWPDISELLLANLLEHVEMADFYRVSGDFQALSVLSPYLSPSANVALESACDCGRDDQERFLRT